VRSLLLGAAAHVLLVETAHLVSEHLERGRLRLRQLPHVLCTATHDRLRRRRRQLGANCDARLGRDPRLGASRARLAARRARLGRHRVRGSEGGRERARR